MMKISDHVKEKMFGYEVTYRYYQPERGSRNLLICLHGIGEKGPADGSSLNLVEKVKCFPRHAAQGIDFPFNIAAIQTDVDGYSIENKVVVPYLKLKYGIDKIIITGYSMGGIGTYNMVSGDNLDLVDAIAPVCGKAPISTAATFPNIDIWAFHGDKDTVVSLMSDKSFIDAYNGIETHTRKAKLRIYNDVGHNAWDYAYELDTKYDKPNLYTWIMERFLDN